MSKRRSVPCESPVAEAVTVFWMLTIIAASVSDLGVCLAKVLAFAYGLPTAVPLESAPLLVIILNMLFLIAMLSGALCLAVTPLVYWCRNQHPPRAITLFALAVSISPWVVAFVT